MRLLGWTAFVLALGQVGIIVYERFTHPDMTEFRFVLTYWPAYIKVAFLCIAFTLAFGRKS